MSLFKHAMVSGINDAMVDRGLVAWPDERVGFEVCAQVASELDGPEMLPESGLAKESALMIGRRLKQASDTLRAQGYAPTATATLHTKQASAMPIADRAARMAEACMTKAAEDASLTPTGPNTAESAVQDDQHAALDQKNRPTNKYLAGVGNTRFPNGGVVGQQMVAPERQSGPSLSNSLTALDKQAFSVTPEGHEQDARHARTIADALSDMQDTNKAYGEKAPLRRLLGLDPLQEFSTELDKRHQAYTAKQHEQGENAYNPFGGMLTPYQKQSNEDMSAADLGAGGGVDPAALERAMLMLQAMKNKGHAVGPEAQVAAAGLGQAGTPGMEVMAHVLSVKTAAEADDIIAQILQHQGQAGQLASPELVAAIEQMMAQGQGGAPEGAPPQGPPPQGPPPGMPEDPSKMGSVRSFRRAMDVGHDIEAGGSPFMAGMRAHGRDAMDWAKKHPKSTAAGGAAAGVTAATLGIGALNSKKKDEKESKAASLLAQLKAAADDGSLTDVGQNTPESAAHDDQVAELDQKNRATNEYLIGQGGASKLPNKGQQFAVEPAPKHDAISTSNIPTNETKSAEEARYVASFRKIASDLGPHLPATMPRETKIAHLQTMLGMPPGERSGYLKALRTS